MTNNEFLDELSRICNNPEFDKKLKRNTKRKILRIGILCTVSVALIVGSVCFVSIFGKQSQQNNINNMETSDEQISEDNVTYSDYSETDTWFEEMNIEIEQLSYSSMNKSVKTLTDDSFGPGMISTEVFGEHENCPGVYYDIENDSIICLYHEFLYVAQITINDGVDVEFISDSDRNDFFVARMYDKTSLLTEGLWVFNRITGSAFELPLPSGCNGYNEVYVYNNALFNGNLCVGINSSEQHYIYVYNTETKEGIKLIGGYSSHVSAEFLSDKIIIISNNGYYFYNTDNGKTVNVVGEYNYYADGKVFSVKNWGWAKHNEVEVAVYDSSTGELLENQDVLVQTVLDNGEIVLLKKTTGTGEETILLNDYKSNCCTWTRDGKYFYAFSATNQNLLCYSASDGAWFIQKVSAFNTEPEVIDDETQAVFESYAVSTYNSNNSVLIYYTRVIEALQTIPDYEAEIVESPFWNLYREIKALNFAEETCFGFAVKENIYCNGGGSIVYIGSTDMEMFRNIILDCFEKGMLIQDKELSNENVKNTELSLNCGFLSMDFFYEDGTCYLSMGYHKQQPVGFVSEIYEIPEVLFEEINEYCYSYK